MKKYFTIPICLSLLVFSSLVSAETKTFVKEYSYQASEYDSKVSCRALALEQVKRLLLEELGTYLESETEVKNFQLTKDQIVILTAGIVRSEIIEERWDGKTYYLKAKIVADPKDVANSIENLRQDRQKTKELEETRKKADEALKEVDKLKKELETAKAEKPDLSQYNKAVNGLSATDWFEKGVALLNAGKSQDAIEAASRAIELDPKYAKAYLLRGAANDNLGDSRQAINYYDRAIELDPKYATAYSLRGAANNDLGDYRQAIEDYDRAIELDPKNAIAYRKRGDSYIELRDYRQAIKDYDRAIQLDPKYALAYHNRGNAYGKLKQNQKKINDLKIAARLGHKEAQDSLRSAGISW
jgi:tetratricopeptide (TPR) repeat protein